MIVEKACWERGCACYDYRLDEGIEVTLVQPKQEPVAYLCENAVGHKYFRRKKPPSEYKPTALYTAPPQREFIGLTEDEYEAIRAAGGFGKGSLRFKNIFEAIETQLKEKNT